MAVESGKPALLTYDKNMISFGYMSSQTLWPYHSCTSYTVAPTPLHVTGALVCSHDAEPLSGWAIYHHKLPNDDSPAVIAL